MMKILALILAFVFLFLPMIIIAQEYTWSSKTDTVLVVEELSGIRVCIIRSVKYISTQTFITQPNVDIAPQIYLDSTKVDTLLFYSGMCGIDGKMIMKFDTIWASQTIEWKYKGIDSVVCYWESKDSVEICDTIWIDCEISHSEAMYIKDNE